MKTKFSFKKALVALAVVLLACGAQAATTITIPALSGVKDKDGSPYTGDAYIVYMGSAVSSSNHDWGKAFQSTDGLDINNPPSGQIILKFSFVNGASTKQTVSAPGTGINMILTSTYQSAGKDYLFVSNGNIMTAPLAALLTSGSWFTGKYASAGPEPTSVPIAAIAVDESSATVTMTNSVKGLSYQLLRCEDLGVENPEFTAVGDPVDGDGSDLSLIDADKPAEKAFYKVLISK